MSKSSKKSVKSKFIPEDDDSEGSDNNVKE